MVQGFLRDLLHLPSHQMKVVGADAFQSGPLVKWTCLASGMLSWFPVMVRAGAWSLVVSSVPPSPFPSFLFLLLPYSLSWEWTGAYFGRGGRESLRSVPSASVTFSDPVLPVRDAECHPSAWWGPVTQCALKNTRDLLSPILRNTGAPGVSRLERSAGHGAGFAWPVHTRYIVAVFNKSCILGTVWYTEKFHSWHGAFPCILHPASLLLASYVMTVSFPGLWAGIGNDQQAHTLFTFPLFPPDVLFCHRISSKVPHYVPSSSCLGLLYDGDQVSDFPCFADPDHFEQGSLAVLQTALLLGFVWYFCCG